MSEGSSLVLDAGMCTDDLLAKAAAEVLPNHSVLLIHDDVPVGEEELVHSRESQMLDANDVIKRMEADHIIDLAGAKLFERYSLFDMLLQKAQLHPKVGIMEVLLKETEVLLRELRILIERCLMPTRKKKKSFKAMGFRAPWIRIPEDISRALQIEPGRYMRRRLQDIHYNRYNVDLDHLLSDDNVHRDWPLPTAQSARMADESDTLLLAIDQQDSDDYEDLQDKKRQSSPPNTSLSNAGQRCIFYCGISGCPQGRRAFYSKKRMREHLELVHHMGIGVKEESGNALNSLGGDGDLVELEAHGHDKKGTKKFVVGDSVDDDDGDVEYPCLRCGKILKNSSVKFHEQKCQGISVRHPEYKKVNDEYMCTVVGCNLGYTFNSIYGLRQHFHAVHVTDEEKVFVCPYCDERFSFKTTRNKHIKQRHEKDHHCGQCGKSFDSKNKLLMHIRTHTGEKPFACDKCNYRAAKKYNLDTHKKVKHNDQGSGTFACEICGKLFQTSGRVRRHIEQIHENSESNQGNKAKKKRSEQNNEVLQISNTAVMSSIANGSHQMLHDQGSEVQFISDDLEESEIIAVPFQAI